MSIAIFIQSDPDVDGFRRETLFYPGVPSRGESEPAVWTRLSNGNRGRGNRWERKTSLDAALDMVPDDEPVLRVVGIGITPTNARDIVETGQSGSVTTRALASTHTAPLPAETLHDCARLLYYRLVDGDQALVQDIVDGGVYGPVSPVLSVDPLESRDSTHRYAVSDDSDDEATPVAVARQPEAIHTVEDDEPVEVPIESVGLVAQEQGDGTVVIRAQRQSRFIPYDVSTLMVPRAVARSYVGRTISGVRDMDILDTAYANSWNVRIEGPTGPGKTMFVRAWAALRRKPLVRIQGDGALNLQMLLGMRDIDADGTFWVDGSVSAVCRHGGVILIDEINFIPAKMLAAFYSMLDDDRAIRLMDNNGEVVRLHEDTIIVSTMNPDYLGTQELNFALKNRFEITLDWGYDQDVEKALGVHQSLLDLASELRAEAASEHITTPTPTNALLEFQDIGKVLGLTFAIDNLVNRFDPTEREAVRKVIEAQADNLAEALAA